MRKFFQVQWLLIYGIILLSLKGYAQKDTTVYQLSGMVVNKRTGNPIPYVKIRIAGTRRGGIC
ncbi:MAG: carboxypeptidase-like regulatory domain-containing protein, partial [Bacteroidia bacterium]|nr:carboxypeptidase-like regulatory domain-containing protein [Bacteroidia bacterium]